MTNITATEPLTMAQQLAVELDANAVDFLDDTTVTWVTDTARAYHGSEHMMAVLNDQRARQPARARAMSILTAQIQAAATEPNRSAA